RLAQPRPEPGGQALAVSEEPRDPLDGAWLVHPVLGREARAGGEALALEQVDPRVVRGEPVRRPLEGLADERVAALRELRDDRVELGAEPVVGHRAAVRLELLAVHPVRADAEEQALGPDLQVLAAHRAGAAAAELQRRPLLVRPLVLREAQVAVGPVDVPLAERALQLARQRLERRANVLEVPVLVRLPERLRVVAVQLLEEPEAVGVEACEAGVGGHARRPGYRLGAACGTPSPPNHRSASKARGRP